MRERTLEEKRELAAPLRPIDDALFELLANNTEVMQEILRTILEDDKLVVADVVVQNSQRNIYGRSVRLDALCVLGDGVRCNVEVQRADDDDHFRRTRYNEAMITSKVSSPGSSFKNIPDVWVVYISEKDIIGQGLTIYHVNKVIAETGNIINDGTKEIFVNAENKDNSDVSELMSCFLKPKFQSEKFPILTSEMIRLKNTEGGLNAVCGVIDAAVKESNEHLLFSLVQDGDLSLSKGAAKLKISIEAFKEKMILSGYEPPKKESNS